MTRVFLFLLTILVTIGCSSSPTTKREPPADEPKKEPKKEPKTEPAVPTATPAVTAEEVAKAYETDKDAAEKQYKGKSLVVEGVVEEVLKTPEGPHMLRLKGFKADPSKDHGHSVRAAFESKAAEKLVELIPGQKVRIAGKCQGENAAVFVDLTECVFGEIGPDPSLVVSAADLATAYAADEKAADAKYKDKWVIVVGMVRELQDKTVSSVLLEGSATVTIAASYSADQKSAFAPLMKGQNVKVKGVCNGFSNQTVFVNKARLVK